MGSLEALVGEAAGSYDSDLSPRGRRAAMTAATTTRLEHPYRSSAYVAGLTHGLYRYPARFSPGLPAAAIEAFTDPGDVVLDPFVGGGTSAVEALVRGRRFVGFDINPLAVLLTEVKTTPLPAAELRQLRDWARAGHAPAGLDLNDVRLRNAPLELVEQLAPFAGSIGRMPTRRLELAGRALLMDAAQWAIDGRQSALPAEQLPAALLRSFDRLEQGLGALVEAGRANGVRPSEFPQRRVLRLGSAQSLALHRGLNRLAGRVRLVVTSPPYPGVHVLYHRWQVGGRAETPMVYWLAGADDGLGPKHYTMGSRSAYGEETYFAGVEKAWSAVRRLLTPDALVLQLIAFSDAEAQLPRYVETMESAGYARREDLEPEGWRDVPNRRWYYRVQPGRGNARERLLVHEPR